MKKNILALSILAVCASGTASAIEVVNNDTTKLSVGGFVEARYQTIKLENVKDDEEEKNASRSRINLIGEQVINDSLTAFGKLEIQFNAGKTGQENRAMYAGVKGEFGSLSFGRNEPTEGLKNARGLSDIGPHQVEDTRNKPDTFDGWAASQLTYKYSNDMFEASAIYALQDDDATGDNNNAGDVWATSAKFKTDFGLSVGVGYGLSNVDKKNVKVEDGQPKATKNQKEDVVYVGAQYGFDAFTVGATWHKQSKDADAKGYEVSGKYVMDEWSFGTSYSVAKFDKDANKQKEDKFVSVSTSYQFTPAFKAFAGVSINQADKKRMKNEKNHLRFGVKYSF